MKLIMIPWSLRKGKLCYECSKGTDCKSGICKNGRCVEEIGYSNTFTNCE